MRSGGPKLFCSPYFSIGAILILVVVTMKYYSLSSEHENLLLKVSVLQNQMKLTASNMRNLDTSLSRKEEAFSECVSEKTGIEEKLKTVSKDSVQKSADIKSLQEINNDATGKIREYHSQIEKFDLDNKTMLEELKYLRRRNEELNRNDEECRINESKIAQLEGELNTIREDASKLHAKRLRFEEDAAPLQPKGELPDLDPGAVVIRQPALNGMRGHGVPILPRGDPNAPRPNPRLAVDNFGLTNDEQARQKIIKTQEEEEEEYEVATKTQRSNEVVQQQRVVQDHAHALAPNMSDDDNQDGKPLRNPDYEHRIALERKPLQKPDFEHRIALDGKPLRKPDAEHVDEEKAVLKLPHNLDEESKKLNFDQHRFGNSLEDARPVARAPAAVIDDQAQFPDDQARDPAQVLEDPRARDQDNDDRIVEAVRNGFSKRRWRNV